jgi:hypothetical protein
LKSVYFIRDHFNFDGDNLDDDNDDDDDNLDQQRPIGDDDENGEPPVDDTFGIDRSSNDTVLMRDFLQKAVKPYTYISIPKPADTPDSQFDVPLKCFQVLDVERTNIFINDVDRLSNYGLRWSIQPFELWRGEELPAFTVPEEMFAFRFGEPVTVDMLRWVGISQDVRSSIHKWSLVPSDMAGCLCLQNAEQIKPPMALTASDIPVLSLLDELKASCLFL